MIEKARSLLEQSWPLLGSLYLLYLSLQAPPIRYVGIGGLVVVTPLLFGWFAGVVLGVGPWADDPEGAGQVADADDGGVEATDE